MSNDKFADIKVGDEVGVYVNFGWNGRVAQRVKVTHVTPKRFEAGGSKYKKSNGRSIGGNYHGCYPIDEYFTGKIEEGNLLKRHNAAMRTIRIFEEKHRVIENQDLETVERIANFLDGELSKLEEKK
jgi:hypothetical protein